MQLHHLRDVLLISKPDDRIESNTARESFVSVTGASTAANNTSRSRHIPRIAVRKSDHTAPCEYGNTCWCRPNCSSVKFAGEGGDDPSHSKSTQPYPLIQTNRTYQRTQSKTAIGLIRQCTLSHPGPVHTSTTNRGSAAITPLSLHSTYQDAQKQRENEATNDLEATADDEMTSRDDIKGLLSVTAATAAAASIALFQKTRAATYEKAAKQQHAQPKKQHAPAHTSNGHAHDHNTHSLPDAAHGYELFPIDYTMHVLHRRNAFKKFLAAHPETKTNASAILLHGGEEVDRYDTDTAYAFRQEGFFQYLFGVREPGCAGFLDLKTQKSVLLVPRLSAEWELWCGERKPLAYFKNHYKVDEVYFMDEILPVLQEKFSVQHLYVLQGKNNDSGLTTTTTSTFEGIDKFTVSFTELHPVLVECRYIKSEKELELMRFINNLSSQAHIQVMKSIRPGKMEFHAESYFLHHCYSQGGSRLQAYTCICGSGHNASALHYGHAGAPNDKILENGDIFLCDMGAELHGYSSDITCTFPVNGKFTADQRMIYEGVLKAHDAVIAAVKPGVTNVEMHLLSHRVLTQHLLEHGLFQNGTVDELMDHEISAYFYPHGLGHVLGLDVHDVGGFPVGHKRSEKKILQKLRYVRTYEKNVVFTVEPGCYFIEAQIQDVLSNPATAKFINQEMLARFRGTGGVRIESDVIVTAHGVENMTKVPRTVEDIEAVMNSK